MLGAFNFLEKSSFCSVAVKTSITASCAKMHLFSCVEGLELIKKNTFFWDLIEFLKTDKTLL